MQIVWHVLVFQFDKWTDSQRMMVLEDLVGRCKIKQLEQATAAIAKRKPTLHDDFTRSMPRVLSLYVFSYLDPRSLCRCSQVGSSVYASCTNFQDTNKRPRDCTIKLTPPHHHHHRHSISGTPTSHTRDVGHQCMQPRLDGIFPTALTKQATFSNTTYQSITLRIFLRPTNYGLEEETLKAENLFSGSWNSSPRNSRVGFNQSLFPTQYHYEVL